METQFTLYYDTKETVWHRAKCKVKADTLEEATDKLRRVKTAGIDDDIKSIEDDVYTYDNEYLLETSDIMTPEENDGQETEIILLPAESSIGEPTELWSNAPIPT
jgi:hypothetical protein